MLEHAFHDLWIVVLLLHIILQFEVGSIDTHVAVHLHFSIWV